MGKKRICVIAFKHVRSTIHVLRQIDYLAPHFHLNVIGYGTPDPEWPPVAWHALPEPTLPSKIAKLFWFALGHVFPSCYDAWYWSVGRHKLALAYAISSGADAFHANDW